MKTYTEHIFEELIDNSTEEKIRRYIERKRKEAEERDSNKLHPKTREELQDMIIDAIEKNGPEVDLNYIDVSNIDDIGYLFFIHYSNNEDKNKILRSFNGDISEWDVSNVTNMSRMFCYAKNFNGDISGWDVSGVEYMDYMFDGAENFDRNISGWDVSSVTNMGCMFCNAKSFTQNISGWDVGRVTDMGNMFRDAELFNGDISKWNVSSVTNMSYMFYNAKSFNHNISGWNVDIVHSFKKIFEGCPIQEEFKPKKFQN